MKDYEDVWKWRLDDSSTFTFIEFQEVLGAANYPVQVGFITKWCNSVPLKVNTFVWKVVAGRIPTLGRVN
ncbi:hypothetical protein HanIR_Chr04g0163561 [Helianthus annuus]|nr:hypothetical protein HanIR_Chr04g0163561 [Helianthus annuus]